MIPDSKLTNILTTSFSNNVPVGVTFLKGSFKKYVCSKLPVVNPPPPFVRSCLFYMYPLLQCTFALVSYPSLKKIPTMLMTLISNKKSGSEKRKRINFFVNSK